MFSMWTGTIPLSGPVNTVWNTISTDEYSYYPTLLFWLQSRFLHMHSGWSNWLHRKRKGTGILNLALFRLHSSGNQSPIPSRPVRMKSHCEPGRIGPDMDRCWWFHIQRNKIKTNSASSECSKEYLTLWLPNTYICALGIFAYRRHQSTIQHSVHHQHSVYRASSN